MSDATQLTVRSGENWVWVVSAGRLGGGFAMYAEVWCSSKMAEPKWLE